MLKMMFLLQKGLRSKEKVLNKDAKGLKSVFGPKVPVFAGYIVQIFGVLLSPLRKKYC